MLDHDYDGYLSLSEVDQLLATILPAYEESISPSQIEENSNRGSLYFDATQKRFTYARTKMGDADKHKIGSSILNSLSLDKISELKYIYQMADRENKGFAEFDRIKNSINLLKMWSFIGFLQLGEKWRIN
jgi:Ca2+-binding EF-hand superfamily protein